MSKLVPPKVHWRKNVLFLITMAYGALIIIFVAMAAGPMTAQQAYDNIHSAFMALVGGTLAISKDLVDSVAVTEGKSAEFTDTQEPPGKE